MKKPSKNKKIKNDGIVDLLFVGTIAFYTFLVDLIKSLGGEKK